MAFSSDQSGYSTQKQSSEDRGSETSKDQGDEPLWHWMTRDAAGFFTLWLVIVGGCQLVLFYVQLRLIRESLIDTKNAADAAKRSADATMRSTRAAIALRLPIIRVDPDKVYHGEMYDGERLIENCGVDTIDITNLGDTKAFPKEVLYGFFVGENLPAEVSYQFAEKSPLNCMIEHTKITHNLGLPKVLKPGQWSEICSGNRLWFYCGVHYDDFMGEPHIDGFCWRWAHTGIGMGWRADDTPAYNRKT